MVEKIISDLPAEINKVRTMNMYHLDEAYGILCQSGAISCDFEFVVKILHGDHVFSQDWECLRKAISEMAVKEQSSTALFCCEPYVSLRGVVGAGGGSCF